MYRRLHALLVASTIFAAGCDGLGLAPDHRVCTAEYRFGLVVAVRDAATGAPLGGGATVRAREAGFSELLQAMPAETGDDAQPLQFVGVGERPGTYEVTVTRPGYAPWQATGVVIGHDGCHVTTVHLEARLERAD